MIRDKQGNELSRATQEAADIYVQAIEVLNLYRGDPLALLNNAIGLAPDFAMAYIVKAYLLGVATEPEATAEASALVRQLKGMSLTRQEQSHVTALQHLVDGNWTRAALVLDRHNMEHPFDLVALQAGHLIDFYRANGRNLRDRIARVLPQWSEKIPGYSIVLGMYAFGLEENGDYSRAEAIGRQAVDMQPLDCWAHHAVAHVMEMQGRAEDGIGWMVSRHHHWAGDDNFFKVHNFWHQCLFYLDLEQPHKAIALYDRWIRNGRSTVALDLVDASALLWRLNLLGVDVGDRWVELAECWDLHVPGSNYPFNDWHAAMAYAGAERTDDLEQMLGTLQVNGQGNTEAARWTRETGIPLVKGFKAFWQGDYRQATDLLYDAGFIANSFGGSNAQRDIIDLTSTEAALRGNLQELGQALTHGRLALKSRGAINRQLFARSAAALRMVKSGVMENTIEKRVEGVMLQGFAT